MTTSFIGAPVLPAVVVAHSRSLQPHPAQARLFFFPARPSSKKRTGLEVLTDSFLENDLVAVVPPPPAVPREEESSPEQPAPSPRLCVVRPDGVALPLCSREDDDETDLFLDPRELRPDRLAFWTAIADEDVVAKDDGVPTYGEGWYGQRPVPSLGGGPGYGAEADEVWSVDEELLETLRADGVDVPVLDVGIAHGEKARGGALF